MIKILGLTQKRAVMTLPVVGAGVCVFTNDIMCLFAKVLNLLKIKAAAIPPAEKIAAVYKYFKKYFKI